MLEDKSYNTNPSRDGGSLDAPLAFKTPSLALSIRTAHKLQPEVGRVLPYQATWL
jgi:hypothetical protein